MIRNTVTECVNFLEKGVQLFVIFPIYLVLSCVIVTIDNWRSKRKWSIEGDVAVITGAAGGLGKCIAAELAAEGCHVAICDINYEMAVSTAKEIADKYGVKAKAYKVDVTKYEQIVELNKKLTKDIGIATILVNNAGILLHTDQLKPKIEEIQLMINVNYMAHFLTNRVFLENMKQAKRGHIVAISSVAGLLSTPFSEPYCSCKTAVRTLMRCLRVELKVEKMDNIHLTTVFPSFLQTHAGVKELVAKSHLSHIYPLIKGEEVAKRVVRGMLRGEVEIAIPEFFIMIYRLFNLLPAKAQDWLYCMTLGIVWQNVFEKLKSK